MDCVPLGSLMDTEEIRIEIWIFRSNFKLLLLLIIIVTTKTIILFDKSVDITCLDMKKIMDFCSNNTDLFLL